MYRIRFIYEDLKDVLAHLRNEKGSIAVETMLIMPALAFMYVASFTWFDAFRQKTLAMKATYTVSDIISRQETIDEPYLEGLHDTLKFLVDTAADPKMRVTLIHYDADATDNKYRMIWSWASDDKPELTQALIDGDTSWIPVMGDDEAVVVTESFTFYQPGFKKIGITSKVWENTMVTRPRFAPTLTKTDEPVDNNNQGDIDNEGDSGSGI